MLILDLLRERVRQRADHVFLHHQGRRVTYAEFAAQVHRAANALLALGVGRGDRVTVAMGNSIEYLVALFGILEAGAIYNPVNARLGATELGHILRHAEPRLLLTDRENLDSLRTLATQLPANCSVAVFDAASDAETGDAVVDFSAAVAAAPAAPPPIEISADDPSTLLYTSGTTGNPKGVLFHHGSTGAAGRHFQETLGITADDTILAVTPLFHGNAWGAVVTALQAGGTVAFPVGFRASEFWGLVEETGATVLYTLGTILAILLTQPESEQERRSRLRVILGLGSAPIRDRIIERFGVEHVAECFGSTDAGVVTITPLGAAPRDGSAGPPVPGVEIAVRDDAGTPLATGEVGEITISSPHRMAAYFRDPEQTAEALRDGWFFTGDLGYVDADGWLYFVDRKRDVIRRGGENMSSVLIEKTLREHPKVIEAAVIGVPDPVLGQEVKAFLVVDGEVSVDELRGFAAARLAKFQVPRLWEFRDSLPKTPTQRVEKYKLRQETASGKPLLG
jgi:acyl-CoA synthetase (AMP-forming)/AMP-acid ligase II